MGTSPDLESLLITLRAYGVSHYSDGACSLSLFPLPEEPEDKPNQVAKADQGKVAGQAETPYHKLFKGNPPAFKRAE